MYGHRQHVRCPLLPAHPQSAVEPSEFPLLQLPTELLLQIFRLAFIPDRLIVSGNSHEAVIHYWRTAPASSASPDTHLDTQVYQRFRPSDFAITRSIYTEIWNLFRISPVVWHFVNADVAEELLCPRGESQYPVIPPSIQQLIRHVSLPYKASDSKLRRGQIVEGPTIRRALRIITKFKASPWLKTLDLNLPWPDWEHDFSILPDLLVTDEPAHYALALSSIQTVFSKKPHPLSDLRIIAQIIADFCWQGIETRCPLWSIHTGNLKARDPSSVTLDERVQPIKQYGGSSSPFTSETFPLASIENFFQTVDPQGQLRQDQMLTRNLTLILANLVGAERIKIIFPEYPFRNDDAYAGVRALLVVS